jgi:HNH endonuclease
LYLRRRHGLSASIGEADPQPLRKRKGLAKDDRGRATRNPARRPGHIPRRSHAVLRQPLSLAVITEPALLRASHIVPWADCDDEQRLNVHNGLLLSALWDAAFDKGLVSFAEDGTVLASQTLSETARRVLGVDTVPKLRGFVKSTVRPRPASFAAQILTNRESCAELARGSPVGETWRYRVDRVIPSSRQRSPTFVSGLPIARMASRSLAGVIFGLQPPLRPRARAEARPARVRSEMRSRSNSAREPKMPKTSLPAGVVVSIAAP